MILLKVGDMMAFPVEFFYFNKRMNSTAQPDTTGATYNCLLKSPSSIVSPTLILQLPTAVNPSLYNYCYIEIYHRYYYVREMTFNDACWEIDLVVDPLASWKTNIGEYSGYILRSSSQYDGTIMDVTYPIKQTASIQMAQSTENPWTTNYNEGMFCMGVAGSTTQYYAFIPAIFYQIIEWIFSDSYAEKLFESTGKEWVDAFPSLKAQINPAQYITSIVWLPFFVKEMPGGNFKYGWVELDRPLASEVGSDVDALQIFTETFDIPQHPQVSRGVYLNTAPYSEYYLVYPGFGKIQLDPNIISNAGDAITITVTVDIRTGEATLKVLVFVNGVGNEEEAIVRSRVGVPFQVSQVLNSGFGLGNAIGTIGKITSSAMAGPGGIIASTASGIRDVLAGQIPSVNTVGSNGSIDSLRGQIQFISVFHEIVDEDFDHRGRPLCQVRQISSIPGFIMCADADIGIWGTVDEQQQIREYMEEGFFYE